MGLFETLAVRAGRPLDLAPHLDRMERGADRIGAEPPPRRDLSRVVECAAAEEPSACAWLKIVLTRGGRWYVFTGEMDSGEEGRPISAVMLPWRRSLLDPLGGLKSLNYAANLIGLEQARRRGAEEGIWRNSRGHLAEGCTSNLFVVRRRKLFTPSTREGILPGVVRALVLRHAVLRGIVVHRGKVRVKRLAEADEAFVTSSLRGVRPLIRFEGRPLGSGRPGPLTREIAEGVAAMRQGG
jgi:branched-subunit amino acid aminotransferase/4-amino-4-deoxychorismate lyase